jgi:elongation factor P
MITTDQFRNGITLKIDGTLYKLVEFQHVKPGKGGAFVRTRLKNLKLKTVIDRTFNAGQKVEDVFIDQRKWMYLYHQDGAYFFMDQENFEQKPVSADDLGEAVNYLKDNMEVTANLAGGELVEIIPPTFVELEVTQAEPGVKGDTAKGGNKPAQLETGLTVQVPLFINTGDVIRIDTRTGKYVSRV